MAVQWLSGLSLGMTPVLRPARRSRQGRGDCETATVTRSPRAGYHSVTTRLVVDDVEGLVQFFRRVFGATGEADAAGPIELRLGDSVIMVSPTAVRDAFPGFLYVYVEDADSTFDEALRAGATAIEAPFDTPYGDRRAMVRDPFGNILQIAHPL